MPWRLFKFLRVQFVLIAFFAWTVLVIAAAALNVGHIRVESPPALFVLSATALALAFFLIAPLFSTAIRRLVLTPGASLDEAQGHLVMAGAVCAFLGLACLAMGIAKL